MRLLVKDAGRLAQALAGTRAVKSAAGPAQPLIIWCALKNTRWLSVGRVNEAW